MSFRPLTYKKVYVNSQYRVSDSRSSSDFKIELQDAFEIPDNTIMQVHEVAIPNAWYSIIRTIRTCTLDTRYCHLLHPKA